MLLPRRAPRPTLRATIPLLDLTWPGHGACGCSAWGDRSTGSCCVPPGTVAGADAAYLLHGETIPAIVEAVESPIALTDPAAVGGEVMNRMTVYRLLSALVVLGLLPSASAQA